MSDADTVVVQPVCTYGGVDGVKTPRDEPYSVSRARAAELRANGLIEYTDAADETAAVETAASAAGDAIRLTRQARAKPITAANIVEPAIKA